MMSFIHDDFILQTETAKALYHKYAENMPIIDYHCHINPKEIYENRKFENITQIWLGGDHYKWRLIRSNGVCENEITGDADDKTKFIHFAKMLPKAIGNPMYHWCHLELKRYFGYDGILNENTAEEVWNLCNAKLQEDSMSVCSIIEKSGVKMIGTTDDPIDDLIWHKKIRDENKCTAKVLPSFRPDKAVNIDKAGFTDYIAKLSEAANIEINTAEDVKKALTLRLEYFCELGCAASDHGLDYVYYNEATDEEVNAIFQKAMKGESVTRDEAEKYKTAIMLHVGREYAKRNVVMQLHYGAQRNTNTAKFNKLGPDTGFDCISTYNCGEAITAFLNALEVDGLLPKTILYSLNPGDNQLLDTIIGCFQGTEAAGKIQHGSAWWFSDTKSGMEAQLESLANLSILGNFVGMLTDSRSFLSYTRHEYFRRILCNLFGKWVENGEYPADEQQLGQMVVDICYNNAKRYFSL
ncbi:MAG: glucuronate isomerase [Ruminococcaceae bacterium]|nr:glucuronate isomerase [Oscillospiraceae bacterium]